MEQNPSSEINKSSASQDIPHILCNLDSHYHNHKCLACVPILSQINPVHVPQSHFWKMYFNIILSYMLVLQVVSFHQVSHQNPVCTSPLQIYTAWPAHRILDLIAQIMLCEEYKS